MCPSSGSISGPNFVLNAIVAEVLSEFADRLEKAHDVEAEVNDIIIETVKKHKRIIFNGNGYSEDWIEEAARRGLPNITTTVESIKSLLDEKNIEVLEKHNVLTREEVHSRYEISLENYSKTINIEALTLVDMLNKQILPPIRRCVRRSPLPRHFRNATSVRTIKCEAVFFRRLSSRWRILPPLPHWG